MAAEDQQAAGVVGARLAEGDRLAEELPPSNSYFFPFVVLAADRAGAGIDDQLLARSAPVMLALRRALFCGVVPPLPSKFGMSIASSNWYQAALWLATWTRQSMSALSAVSSATTLPAAS